VVEAHVFTVLAVADPSKGAKGIIPFIVKKDFPGFILGKVERKMGLRGSHLAEIFFDNLEVPMVPQSDAWVAKGLFS
jgi:acyl-CoA dehydrogenase